MTCVVEVVSSDEESEEEDLQNDSLKTEATNGKEEQPNPSKSLVVSERLLLSNNSVETILKTWTGIQ